MTRRPLVQIEGADAGDVRAQLPVDTGALDANQHSQINAGPVGIYREKVKIIFEALIQKKKGLLYSLGESQSTHLSFPGMSDLMAFIAWRSTTLALCPPLALLLSIP